MDDVQRFRLDEIRRKTIEMLGPQAELRFVGTVFTDDQMAEALLDLFGRTGVERNGDERLFVTQSMRTELRNHGYITEHVEPRDDKYLAIVIQITLAGHAARVARLQADIELSHYIMGEVERRRLNPIFPRSPDPLTQRAKVRRITQMLLAYETATIDGLKDQFIEDNKTDLVAFGSDDIIILRALDKGVQLAEIIEQLRSDALDIFMGGTGQPT